MTTEQHSKEFDKWSSAKKIADTTERVVFGYPREVWWCALGVNIGAEIDGKNENFERPVIVMRVYNKETMLVLPTTSRARADKFHVALEIEKTDSKTHEKHIRTVYVRLTQARVISNKRLIRKIGVVGKTDFERIQKAFRQFT